MGEVISIWPPAPMVRCYSCKVRLTDDNQTNWNVVEPEVVLECDDYYVYADLCDGCFRRQENVKGVSHGN